MIPLSYYKSLLFYIILVLMYYSNVITFMFVFLSNWYVKRKYAEIKCLYIHIMNDFAHYLNIMHACTTLLIRNYNINKALLLFYPKVCFKKLFHNARHNYTPLQFLLHN